MMVLAMLEVIAGASFGGVGACCTRATARRAARDARMPSGALGGRDTAARRSQEQVSSWSCWWCRRRR